MKVPSGCGWLLPVVSLLPALAQQRTPQAVNFYSIEKETSEGQAASATLRSGLSLIRQPKLDAYLAKLTADLSKQAPGPFPYIVAIYGGVPGAATVALTMPADALLFGATEPVAVAGGAIFVPVSMVADAPNETVLAFQLAHAMAHISLRHATRLATRADISRGGGAQAAPRLAFLAFARQLELEADAAAVPMIAAAGYDPAEVVAYLQKLPPAGNEGMSTAFSAHPTTAERLETIRAEAEKLPARKYGAGTGEFEAMKSLAAGVR
ncbi:MAG: M48 family metalloprotease [Acidobacteriia bacterium]|nr:M48 family metalloprotease [Terriglobia bacterium]